MLHRSGSSELSHPLSIGVVDLVVVLGVGVNDQGQGGLAATSMTFTGVPVVKRQALTGLTSLLLVAVLQPALVNGAAGVVVTMHGRPVTVMGFTVSGGKIVAIDSVADPDRVPVIAAAVGPMP